MVAARIAAICLALASCAALAQQPAISIITVTVTDQSGAVIPGARVEATKQASGLRLEAIADASGRAILSLLPGRYGLSVQARAFKGWKEDNVEVVTEMRRTVSLAIGDQQPPCTLPCDGFDLPIPAEQPRLTAEVALLPMQRLSNLPYPQSESAHDCTCPKTHQRHSRRNLDRPEIRRISCLPLSPVL